MSHILKQLLGRPLILLIVALALLVSVSIFLVVRRWPGAGRGGQNNPVLVDNSSDSAGLSEAGTSEGQLSVGLGEGQPQLQTPEPVTVASGEPLPPEAIERILSRKARI